MASVSVYLCFFVFPIMAVALPVGILTLAILWRQEVRVALAAYATRRQQEEDPAEQQRLYRLALASAALVPVSFFCLPLFQSGYQETLQQPRLMALLFLTMRWLPLWTQGIAVVLGMVALVGLRQEKGEARGLGWALLGALFAPLLLFFSQFAPAARPWLVMEPYGPRGFEPALDRMFWSQSLAAVVAGLLAWWVERARAARMRRGTAQGVPSLVNRTCYAAGVLAVVYAVSFWPLSLALRQHARADVATSALAVFLVALTGLLAHWQLRRVRTNTAGIVLRLAKWTSWAAGVVLLLVAGLSMAARGFPSLLWHGPPRNGPMEFCERHVHGPVPARSEARACVAHAASETITLATLSEPGSPQAICWLPDGTVRCAGPPQSANRVLGWSGQREVIAFLDCGGDGQRLSQMHWECYVTGHGTESNCPVGWLMPHPGVKGIRSVVIQVPVEAQSARLRLGLPSRTWQDTEAAWVWTGDPRALKKKSIRRCNADWDFSIGRIYGTEPLALWYACQVRQEAQTRLVAVDAAGKVHVPGGPPAPTFDSASLGRTWPTAAAFPNLNLRDLRELRAQVRPYVWVEFRNVALRPGQTTRVEVVDAPRLTNGVREVSIANPAH